MEIFILFPAGRCSKNKF